MTIPNKQVVLASRPQGRVDESNFRIVQTEVPPVKDGEVLTRVHYLSLDPYMRGRMEESKSYAAPQPLDQVMIGGTVAEVIESKNPKYQVGDMVVGMAGWQQYQVTDGSMLRKIDTSIISPSAYLGSVGMPGVTAWYGLTQIGKAKPGETVSVTAASGAVGSVVGQLAKLLDCRVVGVAGGKAKCDYVVNELGFDACVDYKTDTFQDDFKAATPNGIDIVFENVGGVVFDAELARMNAFGRIAVCGRIAGYNGEDIGLRNVRSILTNRLLVQGFIVAEHMQLGRKRLKNWPVRGHEKDQIPRDCRPRFGERTQSLHRNAKG
jgi:NADPH-dependent curcumin reductase CurA